MKRTRFLLLFSLSLIFLFGLLMVFSASSAEVLDLGLDKSTAQALVRQCLYALAGLFAAFAVYTIGYRSFLQVAPSLLIFFSILLLLVLIPGLGREVNGSRRWIGFGALNIQPSEFVKYILPATFIQLCGSFVYKGFWSFLKRTLPFGIPILLVALEPNTGTAGVLVLTLVTLFFLMEVPAKYWGVPLLIVTLLGAGFAYRLPYISGRLRVYLHPETDLLGRGHQPYQAKIAVGSGGLLGKGPGNSWQKLSYLPEAQNDYIAAIFAEEFGFLGVLALLILYLMVLYSAYVIASSVRDSKGCYLAGSIVFLIGFQAFVNLGVVSGLLPSTGLNLPFFSQGGSSLVANVMAIGLLLSMANTSLQEQN